ncbi:MAG: DUF6064 family protein [Gemmatimonadales bacterium]|jgi:hypothetical protein
MQLPFSRTEFLDVFAAYNSALWPASATLWLGSLAALVLLVARGSLARTLSMWLAVLWAWSAIAYHAAYFSRINPAAWLFAGVFLFQAVLFVWVGVVGDRLRFSWRRTRRHLMAAALGVYALVYPLLALASGHEYPRTPTFGVPCPITLFTVALLLATDPPLPRALVVIPVLWCLVGGSAAVLLGVTPDLALLVAGLALAVYAVGPSAGRSDARPMRD